MTSEIRPVSAEEIRKALRVSKLSFQTIVPGIIAVTPEDECPLSTLKRMCQEKGLECAIVPPDDDLPGFVVCTGIKV